MNIVNTVEQGMAEYWDWLECCPCCGITEAERYEEGHLTSESMDLVKLLSSTTRIPVLKVLVFTGYDFNAAP